MNWTSGLVWDCLSVAAWVLSVQVLVGAVFFTVWTAVGWRRETVAAREEGS